MADKKSLTYQEIRRPFLTGMLHTLGQTIPGLSLDSFKLLMREGQAPGNEDRNAPGCAFIFQVELPEGPMVLGPVFLHGFTEDTLLALVAFTSCRLLELRDGKNDSYPRLRNRVKNSQFTILYGPKITGTISEALDLDCRLVGRPTAADLQRKSENPQADVRIDYTSLETRVFEGLGVPAKLFETQGKGPNTLDIARGLINSQPLPRPPEGMFRLEYTTS